MEIQKLNFCSKKTARTGRLVVAGNSQSD